MLDLSSFRRDPFRIVIVLSIAIALGVYCYMAVFIHHNLATHQRPQHPGDPIPEYFVSLPPGAAFFLAGIWAVLSCLAVLVIGSVISGVIRFIRGEKGV
jgi:hypothetical protein